MHVFYFLAGRIILEGIEPESPRVGDEVCIEGTTYSVARLVRHIPMCPPDHVHAHLKMAGAESLWPEGHP